MIYLYSYDRNGNQTEESDSVTGQSRIMGYDADNRLSRYAAKEGDAVVLTQENLYNGNGQRIQKKEVKGQDTKENNYYYQGSSVLYTADGTGKRTSLNLIGTAGNVIATSRGIGSDEKWYLYNKDVRKSTISLINDTGTVAAAYIYDDYGNTDIRVDDGVYNEICYTGGIYDQSTQLYYFNSRFYDPEAGRFTSQDTYRSELSKPDTYHLYTYCANDPINYVDENGDRRKPPRPKNETLGWGVTLQASVGQIISSASVGLDIVWFNGNVDTRYKKKQTHAFWHVDADISAGLEKNFKKTLKKKKTKIYSKSGLTEIKKSLKKNAKFNGALSALFFKVYAKKNKVKTYKDFEGPCKNVAFSLAHFTASAGWSGKCKTMGVGITTSTAGAAGGTSNYYFSKGLTDSFRGVFSKSKVQKKAKK